MSKRIRYPLEYALVSILFWMFGLLPFNTASNLGGLLGRLFGPRFSRTRLAKNNIKLALPDVDNNRTDEIIRAMWENLGRVAAEYPHIGKFDPDEIKQIIEVDGFEHVENAKRLGKGIIFFSGHISNWEIAPVTLAVYGCPLALVYRPSNNPGVDTIIQKIRDHYQSEGIPKGRSGSHQLLRALKQGRHIGMLVDQKLNEGIKINFFGQAAMTATAIASLALKYGCPVIPTKVVRTKGAHFKVSFFPAIEITKTDDHKVDVFNITTTINTMLESWIRDNPSQWIWIHNRWGKDE